MANRKRDVQILLWVTPEEKKMIRKRMILSKTSNMSVYLRKMAIDGMIVNTDTTYLKAMYQENLHKDLSNQIYSEKGCGLYHESR